MGIIPALFGSLWLLRYLGLGLYPGDMDKGNVRDVSTQENWISVATNGRCHNVMKRIWLSSPHFPLPVEHRHIPALDLNQRPKLIIGRRRPVPLIAKEWCKNCENPKSLPHLVEALQNGTREGEREKWS